MQKKTKLIFLFVLTVIFVFVAGVTVFADSSSSTNTRYVPDILVPDTITAEVKPLSSSNSYYAAITVPKSLVFYGDLNTTFGGSTSNTIPSTVGNGVYSINYNTAFYPSGNGIIDGYNGYCRSTSLHSLSDSTFGVRYNYDPFVFYPSSLNTPTIFEVVFSGEEVAGNMFCEVITNITYVHPVTSLIESHYVYFVQPYYDYSAGDTLCHFRVNTFSIFDRIPVTNETGLPYRVLSLQIDVNPIYNYGDVYEPLWEPVPAQYRWSDFIYNYYSSDYIPPDASDGNVYHEQIINTRNFSDLLDWLGDVMESVLTTELFVVGNISVTPAILLSTIVGLLLILMVLKFFAGG